MKLYKNVGDAALWLGVLSALLTLPYWVAHFPAATGALNVSDTWVHGGCMLVYACMCTSCSFVVAWLAFYVVILVITLGSQGIAFLWRKFIMSQASKLA